MLAVNLTKRVGHLFWKLYNTDERNQRRSWIAKLNMSCPYIHKEVYHNSGHNPSKVFIDIDKIILKWKGKGTRLAKTLL